MTKVRIENSSGELIKELDVDPGKVLLSQLEAADIEIPNACRTGMCGSCLCFSESGDDHLDKSFRGEPAFPLWEGEIMTCIGSVADTDETVTLQTM